MERINRDEAKALMQRLDWLIKEAEAYEELDNLRCEAISIISEGNNEDEDGINRLMSYGEEVAKEIEEGIEEIAKRNEAEGRN